MAKILKICDEHQAFNYNQDIQTPIGYLEQIVIGGRKLNADFKLHNPVNRDLSAVVGVITNISWDGGKIQPINIAMNVSIQNKQILAQLIHSELTNIEVKFRFAVYEYDLLKKAYYQSFYVDHELIGTIAKQATALAIELDDSANQSVTSPANYHCMLGIVPQPKEQIVELAFSQSAKLAKPWGVVMA